MEPSGEGVPASGAVMGAPEPLAEAFSKDPALAAEWETDPCFGSLLSFGADDFRNLVNGTSCFATTPSERADSRPKIADAAYTGAAHAAFDEFFASYEGAVLHDFLAGQQRPQLHDLFVVLGVRRALDRSTEDQRRFSKDLAEMVAGGQLEKPHLCRAFEKLVLSLKDITLDVPDAAARVFAFIECAEMMGAIDADFVCRLPAEFLALLDNATVAGNPMVYGSMKQMLDLRVRLDECIERSMDLQNTCEIQEFLKNEDKPLAQHQVVVQLIKKSFQRDSSDRERVSDFLDRVHTVCLRPDDYQVGFSRLIGMVADERNLNSAEEEEIIAMFLARAVVDEVLPGSFLTDRFRLHFGGQEGIGVLRHAHRLLTNGDKHTVIAKLQHVWRSDKGIPPQVLDMKHELRDLLIDYFDAAELDVTAEAVRNLKFGAVDIPVVVRQLLLFGMMRSPNHTIFFEKAGALLQALAAGKIVDSKGVRMGVALAEELNTMEDVDLLVADGKAKRLQMKRLLEMFKEAA